MVANSAILIAIIMNYKKVTNPTDIDLTLSYLGDTFFLSAKGSDKFEESVATHWEFIYGFLEVGDTDKPKEEKELTEVIKAKKK